MELGYGRTVWDLVGDRICSAARDAARLFLILLSFAVHGHHGNGISVEGMITLIDRLRGNRRKVDSFNAPGVVADQDFSENFTTSPDLPPPYYPSR